MPTTQIRSQLDDGFVDISEKAAIESAIKGAEVAPSTADQTGTYADWKRVRDQLGQPYDAERVPLSKLKQMCMDPMIGFGLHYRVVPLARANWHMEAFDKSGPNAQVAAFMDAAWRLVHARFIIQWCLSFRFGFQAIVKRFIEQNPGGVYRDDSETNPDKRFKPVWDEGTVNPIIWTPFVTLAPDNAEPLFDNNGGFDGIQYAVKAGSKQGGVGKKGSGANANTRQVDVYRSLWATYAKDEAFGSMYGRPLIAHSYRHWWSYWKNWADRDRAFERMAVPPLIAYHPQGKWRDPDDPTAEPIPYQQIAIAAARSLRSNAVAAVPGTLAKGDGLDEKASNQREWEFKFLETPTVNLEHFAKAFDYLDVMKLRGLFVPENAFISQTGGGNTNIAAQMSEVFTESMALMWDQIADHINRYIIPQLLIVNFPDFVKNGGICRIIGHGFAKADLELMQQLIQLIGQADPMLLGVDFRKGLEQLNIPLLASAEYARVEDLIAARQQGQPPLQDGTQSQVGIVDVPAEALGGATNGGSQPSATNGSTPVAGFSGDSRSWQSFPWTRSDERWAEQTGFTLDDGTGGPMRRVYQQPNEYIFLSADSDFLADLPGSKHYTDKAIKALAVQLRKLWAGHYRAIYTEFGRYVGKASLELTDKDVHELIDEIALAAGHDTQDAAEAVLNMAEERKQMGLRRAQKIAKKLTAGFKVDSQRMKQLQNSTAKAIKKILDRALTVEKKRLAPGVQKDLKIDQDQYQQWLETQIGKLIKFTHTTVDDEFREFLVSRIREGKSEKEIGQEISDHFSEFPTWKAARVARSEVRDAVNAATLMTGESAGLKYTRMTDGTEHDEDCADRNGKLATIRESWNIMTKEHSNGTLGFDLIERVDFSIDPTGLMPDKAPEGAIAFFDTEACTAHYNPAFLTDPEIDLFLDEAAQKANKPDSIRRSTLAKV